MKPLLCVQNKQNYLTHIATFLDNIQKTILLILKLSQILIEIKWRRNLLIRICKSESFKRAILCQKVFLHSHSNISKKKILFRSKYSNVLPITDNNLNENAASQMSTKFKLDLKIRVNLWRRFLINFNYISLASNYN